MQQNNDTRTLIIIGVILLFVFSMVACLPLITLYWLPNKVDGDDINKRIAVLGTYGDMFGLLNAMFSAAAICGLVYTSILTRRQLLLARQEYDDTQAELSVEVSNYPAVMVRSYRLPTTVSSDEEDNRIWMAQINLRVSNVKGGYARDCRAYLFGVAKWDRTSFVNQDFLKDIIRLRWSHEASYEEGHRGIDIPYQVPFRFDIVATSSSKNGRERRIHILAASQDIEREFTNKLTFGNKYLFMIRVVAENAPPITVHAIIETGELGGFLTLTQVHRG